MKTIKEIIKKRKFKKEIDSVRKTFISCGYDVSKMTDEEFIKEIKTMAKEVSRIGLSAKEAGEALRITMEKMLADPYMTIKNKY